MNPFGIIGLGELVRDMSIDDLVSWAKANQNTTSVVVRNDILEQLLNNSRTLLKVEHLVRTGNLEAVKDLITIKDLNNE